MDEHEQNWMKPIKKVNLKTRLENTRKVDLTKYKEEDIVVLKDEFGRYKIFVCQENNEKSRYISVNDEQKYIAADSKAFVNNLEDGNFINFRIYQKGVSEFEEVLLKKSSLIEVLGIENVPEEEMQYTKSNLKFIEDLANAEVADKNKKHDEFHGPKGPNLSCPDERDDD